MSILARPSDRSLVQRMRAGDQHAFDEFFDGFFPGLYRFALLRLGRDPDAAEEVVQAALSRAVTKLHTYRGEAALFTWLCTFCRHEISARWRQRQRAGPPVELVEDQPEVRAALESLAADNAWRSARGARREELAGLVQATLDQLPERYGQVLEWKYLEGLKVAEIAERLELGLKAAESLLTRARQAFRDGFATLQDAPGEPWGEERS